MPNNAFFPVLVIGWESPEYSVAEADGQIEICAVVREGTTQAITLPRIIILTADGTATAPGKKTFPLLIINIRKVSIINLTLFCKHYKYYCIIHVTIVIFFLPDDYVGTPDPPSFNFQPDQATRMCTTITIAMDGILEPPENLFADLSLDLTQRVRFDPGRTSIVISDSDGTLVLLIQQRQQLIDDISIM